MHWRSWRVYHRLEKPFHSDYERNRAISFQYVLNVLIERDQILILTGWWFQPSEKYEFVSWDSYSQLNGKSLKFHGSKPPTNQLSSLHGDKALQVEHDYRQGMGETWVLLAASFTILVAQIQTVCSTSRFLIFLPLFPHVATTFSYVSISSPYGGFLK